MVPLEVRLLKTLTKSHYNILDNFYLKFNSMLKMDKKKLYFKNLEDIFNNLLQPVVIVLTYLAKIYLIILKLYYLENYVLIKKSRQI